jgi:hypothetical protein
VNNDIMFHVKHLFLLTDKKMCIFRAERDP